MIRLTALLAATAVFFGQTVSDPYRYLENATSARTQAWIDAQNARAERVLDAYSGNARIVRRVQQLALTGVQQSDAHISGNMLFYVRETPPQPQPLLVAQPWPSGTPRVLLDPARIGQAVSIDFVWPAPNGRLVAIATSSGGSESATIRVVDSSGRLLSEALGPAGGGTTGPALAWDADSRGFTYGRLPANGSQFGIQLYHHVIGAPQTADRLLLGAISPIAEYQLLTSSDARQAAALVNFGDGSFARVYQRVSQVWRPAVGVQAGIVSGAFAGGSLLVVATANSPNGRIARVGRGGTLTTIVPAAADWAMHDVAPVRGGFLVTQSWGTRWRIAHYSSNGRLVRVVALPQSGIGIDGIASDDSQSQAIIAYSGWTGPASRWVAYDGQNGTLRTIYDLKVPSNAYARVRVHELTAVSKDGTRVPVTVLALAGTPQNGNAPAILTGYGGFRISTAPHFLGANLAWLELGGIYAFANMRGGTEFGEAWHRGGMLTNKQNVFDDFYAAAQALVREKWTNPRRMGIEGG
ncbi:MAG TPA: prolyl oligopeptidase family serine peptidase, partial [Candidatus Baltobacteraceae bacterium]|nr:prolyl oligopeptidase family serine peptidase [Candidatus Baltobacteraceae bacterium]